MHGASTRERRAHLRRRLRQLGVHRRATSSSCSASRRSGFASRSPGVEARSSRPDGAAAELGRPYVLTVATLEPRKNLADARRGACGCSAASCCSRSSARQGWGEQPAARPAGHRPARLRRRRRARAALPRRGGRSPTRRASRASGCRSSRRWPAARRSSRSSHESMDEACGDAAVRADPDDPAAIAAAIERRSSGGTSSSRAASRTRRASRGAHAGRGLPRRRTRRRP